MISSVLFSVLTLYIITYEFGGLQGSELGQRRYIDDIWDFYHVYYYTGWNVIEILAYVALLMYLAC